MVEFTIKVDSLKCLKEPKEASTNLIKLKIPWFMSPEFYQHIIWGFVLSHTQGAGRILNIIAKAITHWIRSKIFYEILKIYFKTLYLIALSYI